MASNQESNPPTNQPLTPAVPGGGLAKKTTVRPPTTTTTTGGASLTLLAQKAAAMQRLRNERDPSIAALNEQYRRTGMLPRVFGSSPLAGATVGTTPGSTPAGIAGTRFQPVYQPSTATVRAAGTRTGDEDIPVGLAIKRASDFPPVPPVPEQTGGRRGRARAMGTALPPLKQPGPEPRRYLRRYGAFISSSPPIPSLPPPALRPDVPPPSFADLAARKKMEVAGRGVVRYPIRYMGMLPDVLSEDFDASTGYNPPPEGERGTEEQEREWEKVRVGSLRGVVFDEWDTSALMRMAQLKGVKISRGEGEAAVREELLTALREVQKAERAVAQKASLEGTDGGRWVMLGTRAGREEIEMEVDIELDEEKDDLGWMQGKVVRSLMRFGLDLEIKEVSLWLSAVTWGEKPPRLVRWAGRNAERDDGYWLGLYVYRMTETGMKIEKERGEKYEREMRNRVTGRRR